MRGCSIRNLKFQQKSEDSPRQSLIWSASVKKLQPEHNFDAIRTKRVKRIRIAGRILKGFSMNTTSTCYKKIRSHKHPNSDNKTIIRTTAVTAIAIIIAILINSNSLLRGKGTRAPEDQTICSRKKQKHPTPVMLIAVWHALNNPQP